MVHLQVEEAKKVGSSADEGAIDLDKISLCFSEYLVHEVCLSAGLLAVEHERRACPD